MILSPTQISLHKSCPRKWYYSYVLKRPRVQTPAQEYGEGGHLIVEHAHRTGELPPPDSAEAKKWPAIVGAGKMFIYKPHPKIRIEEKFTIQLISGAGLTGRMDIVNESGEYINCLGQMVKDGNPEVTDHKFNASSRYWKNGSDLRQDIQMVSYAEAAFRGADFVRVSHNYFQSKPPWDAKKATTLLTRKEIQKFWEQELIPEAERIMETKEIDDVSKTKVVLATCSAYGGCEFAGECTRRLSDKELTRDLINSIKKTENTDMGMLDRIQKEKGVVLPETPAAPAAAPTPPQAVAVPAQQAQAEAPKAPAPAAAPAGKPGFSLLNKTRAVTTPPNPPLAVAAPAAAPTTPQPEIVAAQAAVKAADAATQQAAEAVKGLAEAAGDAGVATVLAIEVKGQFVGAHDVEPPQTTEQKRGRGRPPGAKNKAKEAAEAAPAGVVTPEVGGLESDLRSVELDNNRPALRIWANCVPNCRTETLEPYYHNIMRMIGEKFDALDIRSSENPALAFGKWKGTLASVARAFPPEPGDYVMDAASADEARWVLLDALAGLCAPGCFTRGR